MGRRIKVGRSIANIIVSVRVRDKDGREVERWP